MVRASLSGIAAISVAACMAAGACGGSDGAAGQEPLDPEALIAHIQGLPADVSETDIYGEVQEAQCEETESRIDNAVVWRCGVEYKDGTIGGWCAVLRDGEILTNREGDGFVCSGPHPLPAP